VPAPIHGDVDEKTCPCELPVPATRATPLPDERPGIRELLDARVAGVDGEDVSAPIDGDASGAQEACGDRARPPVPCTEAPPLQAKGPGARELLDASVAGVGDEDVPAAVHGDVNGVNELPVPRSLNPTPARGDAGLEERHAVLYSPAEREEEGPAVGELLD